MDTIRKILLGGVLIAPVAFATPAFAQLSPTQTIIKQNLEQKLSDNGSLTSQEMTLLQTLTDIEIRDHKISHRDLYAIGAGAGLVVVGVGAAVSCVYGFLPGCAVAETEAEAAMIVVAP